MKNLQAKGVDVLILLFVEVYNAFITHKLYIYAFFALLLWVVWGFKVYYAKKYKPFKGDYGPTVSVIVPVFQERLDVLRECIKSIKLNNPHEILIVVDERNKELKYTLKKIFPYVKILIASAGKRNAIDLGIRMASGEIIALVSSDTILEKNAISEIVKPLAQPEIEGVCGKVVANNSDSPYSMVFKWLTDMRNAITYPALSVKGSVQVLIGEFYAIRRETYLKLLKRFLNQKFAGKRFDAGDDGWITTLLLEQGYKTAYQSTAVAKTKAPDKFADFIFQQLRWGRNSVRRTLYILRQRWCWTAKRWLYALHTVTNLIKSPLLIVLLAWALVGLYPSLVATPIQRDLWWKFRALIFLAGVSLTRGVKSIPMKPKIKQLLFLPIYALISLFIMVPLKVVATLTPWIGTEIRVENGEKSKGTLIATMLLMFVIGFLPIWAILSLAAVAFSCEGYA